MESDPETQASQSQTAQKASSPVYRLSKKHWLLIIGAIIVLACAVILLKPAKIDSGSKLAQVSVTASGVNPATLQVKAGTTVTWTNNDAKSHQIAADPFPKDDSIPKFNSTVLLLKGDTYSFTFGSKGTFTYHDERNPLAKSLQGKVIVK